MKNTQKWTLAGALLVATIGLTACDVEQTEEASMPDVDVSAEGGNMPEYDVDAADVDVGTREKTVTVPDVDVDMPEDQDER
ncbi:MAG TPA: hypothetical protein ENI17_05740 [Pseudomonas xinjiangensis]|uniref:Secreted protein n=2 Tax=root TaxID=1 RepID=A0A7V1BKH6_9GAMM|nr:hypothetical protein [Halopseudomonas xinjiangensis]HEC47116.1 hypothetical protein [Halopseudomonas xinjiangensis]